MADPIAELLNAITYQAGTLVKAPAVWRRRKHRLPLLTQPLCYIDTSVWQPSAVIPDRTRTRVNEFHARLLTGVVRHILTDGSGDEISTAVITPYRGQARLIRDQLGVHFPGVDVDTVHAYQGDERGLVFVDLPDSPGAPLGSFMRARGRLEEGSRLFQCQLLENFHVVLEHIREVQETLPRSYLALTQVIMVQPAPGGVAT